MSQARRNDSAAMVQGQKIGTEQHYRLSVDSIEAARISTGQYVEYFRSLGATTPTEVSKLAVKHAASFGDLSASQATISATTLNKRVKSGEIVGQSAKAIRWCWSVETRARQIMNVIKAVPSVLDDVQTGDAATPATSATPATPATKGKALPKVKAFSCDRQALADVLTLLEQGEASGEWSTIADAKNKLSALLA